MVALTVFWFRGSRLGLNFAAARVEVRGSGFEVLKMRASKRAYVDAGISVFGTDGRV